jgi:hypothetical protein
VSLAAALSIAHIPLPGPPVQEGDITGQVAAIGTIGTRTVVDTSASLVSLLWLVTCVAILVSYTLRPVAAPGGDDGHAEKDPADAAVDDSSLPEAIPEFSPQGLT